MYQSSTFILAYFTLVQKYQNELNTQKLVPQTERCHFEGSGMRNKEYEKGGKSYSWDQEFILRVMTFPNKFIKQYYIIYTICWQENNQGQLRTNQKMLLKLWKISPSLLLYYSVMH